MKIILDGCNTRKIVSRDDYVVLVKKNVMTLWRPMHKHGIIMLAKNYKKKRLQGRHHLTSKTNLKVHFLDQEGFVRVYVHTMEGEEVVWSVHLDLVKIIMKKEKHTSCSTI